MSMGPDNGTVDLYPFHIRVFHQLLEDVVNDTLVQPAIVAAFDRLE